MARVVAGAAPERANRLMLVAAVAFAGIAAALVFVALQDRGGSVRETSSAAVADAVVAARDVPANTKLTADMLELRSLPSDTALAGVFTDTQGAVGLATRFPVAAGEQITRQKVGVGVIEDQRDVALVLAAGRRGFAVAVTEVTGVGGLLLPGNFVDVIGVFPSGLGAGSAPRAPAAVTLLQNIEVLAVAQEAQEPVPAPSDASAAGDGSQATDGLLGQRPKGVKRQPQARSATLAVSPEQAQLLALVQEAGGVIWLSLRPAGDHVSVPLGHTDLAPLLNVTPGEPER